MLKTARSCRKYVTNSAKSQSQIAKSSVIQRLSQRQSSPELANLEPLPTGFKKAISLKRTEPASASKLIFSKPYPRNASLDPNHPLLKSQNPYRLCPSAVTDIFSAKIIPNGLLVHADAEALPPFEDKPPPSSPLTRQYVGSPHGQFIRHRADYEREDIILACFMVVCGQSAVHKSAVIRSRTKRRIIEALRLIVTRGAKASEDGQRIEFPAKGHSGIENKEWLLKDWTYVVFANLKAYRAPWPTLVNALRQALSTLNNNAMKSRKNANERGGHALEKPASDAKPNPIRAQASTFTSPRGQDQTPNLVEQSQPPDQNRTEDQAATSRQRMSNQAARVDRPDRRQRTNNPRKDPFIPPSRPFSTSASTYSPFSASNESSSDDQVNSSSKSDSRRKREVASHSHFERRDIRAEVVLGTFHETRWRKGYLEKCEMWPKDCVTVELKGDDRTIGTNITSRIEKHMKRLRSLQLEQPAEWRLWTGEDKEDMYSLSEYDFDPPEDTYQPRHQDQTSGEVVSDDCAEGWVLVPMKSGQDQDLTPYITSLIDAKTVLRFLHPKLPHHAGRGYQRNLRTNWVNKDDKFVRSKLLGAIKERRWRRAVLNASWNMGDYVDPNEEENEYYEDENDGKNGKKRTDATDRKTRKKGNTVDLDWLMMLRKKEEARQQIAFERENDLVGDGDGEPNPVMANALLDRRMPWWTPPWHQAYHKPEHSNQNQHNSNYSTGPDQEHEQEDADEAGYRQEAGQHQDRELTQRRQRRRWSDRLRDYDESGI